MLDHLTKEIQEVKENYTDHMTELFFLQVGCWRVIDAVLVMLSD